MREICLHWIYPFQAISTNFSFCGRKAPSPKMREFIFTHDLSISDNFEKLWFLWQKSPPPPSKMRDFFFILHLSILGNFEQLWFWWQISPPPPKMRGTFFTLDLSISVNFEKLWFLWQKSPLPSQDEGFFLHWIYPFQAILSYFGFLWQKSPPPPKMREVFLHWNYTFQSILSNFGYCGRKAPHPSQDEGNFFTLDLSISGNFEQLWFLLQKSLPHPPCGKIFLHWIYPFQTILSYFGFLWQKTPSPQDEGSFFTLELYISINFEQLWLLWQKSPPTLQRWGKFLHWINPFQAILSNFGFCGRKAPTLPRWENFLHWIYPF